MPKKKKKKDTSGVTGTTTSDIAPFVTKLGGDPDEGRCDKCNKEIEDCRCSKSIGPYTVEATVSGQGVSVSPQVAGTDTRFGGPSFEGNFFTEFSPENDVIRNEKVFYSDNNKSVLLPGWEYASDLDDLRFTDEEIEDNELEDEGIEKKEKTGIDWELDTIDHRYKNLLKRLKKIHNI